MSATKQKKDRDAVREEAQERAERIRLEAMRAAEPPGARSSYAERFRARLLEEVEALGGPDTRVMVLAYSRAALDSRGWVSGIHPKREAEVRLQVVDDERRRLGVLPMRGGLTRADVEDEANEDDLRIPRARTRSDRVRRGGSRR